MTSVTWTQTVWQSFFHRSWQRMVIQAFQNHSEQRTRHDGTLCSSSAPSSSSSLGPIDAHQLSGSLLSFSETYRQLLSKGILSFHGDFPSFDPLGPSSDDHQTSDFDAEKATDPDDIPVKISIIEDLDDSIPIRSSSPMPARTLRMLAIIEVLRSAVRNTGCYTFVASAIYLAIDGDDLFADLTSLGSIDRRVTALVLLVIGAVAIPFQVVHALTEFRGGKTDSTIITRMIRNPVTRAKFKEFLVELREAVPYVGAEVRLPRRSTPCSKAPLDETSRKMNTIFHYDSWGDASPGVASVVSSSHCSGWLILWKDYRSSGLVTDSWLQEELMRFKQSVEFEKHRCWRASLEFVLDLQEGMHFPDAEAFLVYPSAVEGGSRFHSFPVYAAFLCLCLDFIYNILFHIITRRFPDHRIVKVIQRNIGHHDRS